MAPCSGGGTFSRSSPSNWGLKLSQCEGLTTKYPVHIIATKNCSPVHCTPFLLFSVSYTILFPPLHCLLLSSFPLFTVSSYPLSPSSLSPPIPFPFLLFPLFSPPHLFPSQFIPAMPPSPLDFSTEMWADFCFEIQHVVCDQTSLKRFLIYFCFVWTSS